jgi:hypothetical protein
VENWIVVLSRTVLNTATFAMVTVAPGSNCEPVIVPHVPAVVTTFGETPAIAGRRPVGGGAGSIRLDGDDAPGEGSDDGTDGEGGNPPHAAIVNAAISSIPILVSCKFAARFLNQHNYVSARRCRMGRFRSEWHTDRVADDSL